MKTVETILGTVDEVCLQCWALTQCHRAFHEGAASEGYCGGVDNIDVSQYNKLRATGMSPVEAHEAMSKKK